MGNELERCIAKKRSVSIDVSEKMNNSNPNKSGGRVIFSFNSKTPKELIYKAGHNN